MARWTAIAIDSALNGLSMGDLPHADLLDEIGENIGDGAGRIGIAFETLDVDAIRADMGNSHYMSGRQLRPRVEIRAKVTSHGNLSIAWTPVAHRGASMFSMGTDFLAMPVEAFRERPFSEILFLRGVEDLMGRTATGNDLERVMRHHVLMLIHCLWTKRVGTLREYARATIEEDLVVHGTDGIATHMSVESVEGRRQAETIAFLDGMREDADGSLAISDMVDALHETRYLLGHINYDQASKRLRPRRRDLTPSALRDTFEMMVHCHDRYPGLVRDACGPDADAALERMKAATPDDWTSMVAKIGRRMREQAERR